LLKEFFESKKTRDILEWVAYLGCAFLLALFINKFIILNAHIPSGSMEKTIMTGDNLFVYRLSYLFKKPKRYDVIVFKYPDNEKIYYIKRVMGLPGEKLEIKNGEVFINDSSQALDDSFVFNKSKENYGPYQIPEDSYFLLGDNRNNSQDSRFWHDKFVSPDEIIGKAIFRYMPHPKLIK
jgi:signal peptidase I